MSNGADVKTPAKAGGAKSRTRHFFGCILILASNIIYIVNNYLIKLGGLEAGEVLFVRGVNQIIFFGLTMAVNYYHKRISSAGQTNKCADEKSLYNLKIVLCLMIYSTFNAGMVFAVVTAIPMMPIGDLIVITFATPAVSVFLSKLVLGTHLTILSVVLSFLIILGDCLVVQPPIIFGSKDDFTQNSLYYYGVAICVAMTFVAALTDILSTVCSKAGVSTHMLMFGTGFASLVIGTLSISFSEKGFSPPHLMSISRMVMLLGSAVMAMLAFWWVALALDLTRDPPLVSMLRCTEILICLLTESIIDVVMPNPLSFSGTLLVLFSVVCMSGHDKIYGLLFKRSTDNKEQLSDVISK